MRRSYRTLSALLAALLCAAPALAADSAAPTAAPIPTALTASAAQGGALHLDLSRDLAGFTPLLADYPQGADAFYELDVSRQPIPIAGAPESPHGSAPVSRCWLRQWSLQRCRRR